MNAEMLRSAVDIADVLLVGAVRRPGAALLVEPRESGHAVAVHAGGAVTSIETLPSELGDAVVARLAVLAGLDILAPEQLARLTVRAGEEAQIFVSIFTSPAGLSAELRRMDARA